MDSEIDYDCSPFLRVYKDGRVERLEGTEIIPPSLDPKTKVQSKDVVFSPELNLSSRLYLPENTSPNKKLPLLVYYHGGAFIINTPFNSAYHNYLNSLVAEAKVIAVSVDYRKVPEHHLPIGYDDSWAGLKWVASHVNGDGPEEWLNSHADFGKVFLGGDSAGANIAHQMSMRHGQEKLAGVSVVGMVLVHPYFWGKESIGKESENLAGKKMLDELWQFACPTSSGCDDPLVNPLVEPKLASLGCSKVLVVVAGKDLLRDRGWRYYEKLKECGWKGLVEIREDKDEDHVFHLENPACQNAGSLLKRIASFINEDKA